jgi:hypothetical protein
VKVVRSKHGKEVMTIVVLLDQRGDQIPITEEALSDSSHRKLWKWK